MIVFEILGTIFIIAGEIVGFGLVIQMLNTSSTVVVTLGAVFAFVLCVVAYELLKFTWKPLVNRFSHTQNK